MSGGTGWIEELRTQLIDQFPFHAHLGLKLDESGRPVTLLLPDDGTTRNHVGTHSGASLFAVADAASAAALIVGLRPHLTEFAGVVSRATMSFLHPSVGSIKAVARTAVAPVWIAQELLGGGRVRTDVESTLTDEAGKTVCQVVVTWHLRPPSDEMPALWRRDPASGTAPRP